MSLDEGEPLCPECECPESHHLKGIGCTTIVGYRVYIYPARIGAPLLIGELLRAETIVEDPLLCFCARGEYSSPRKEKLNGENKS